MPITAYSADRTGTLEEVIVTAQKRAESLQDAPIAISVMDSEQLAIRNVASLQDLSDGAIPSLRVQGFANSPTTLIMAIRGVGPQDPGQITREGSIASYLDGIYLGRAQGLGMEVADLARIEVLRGPQGTLFGRNAIAGVVSMISKKPSGEFRLQQIVGFGNYGAFKNTTRVDFPEFNGFKAKFDYVHSQREGWVNNTAPGEADYNAYKKDGGRLSINYQTGNWEFDYAFDRSRLSAVEQYFQSYMDHGGLVGEERDREMRTRAPAIPLDPTVTFLQGHAFTASWSPSELMTVKSLTAYRRLGERTNSNYGSVIYYNGLVVDDKISQDQFSQEFQLIGSADRLQYVAGLYYYHENAREQFQNLYSLDTYGLESGIPNSPIIPATTWDIYAQEYTPLRDTVADTKSWAAYAQGTWTPNILEDKLELMLGARFTYDKKYGSRVWYKYDRFKLSSSHTDPAFTMNYRWNDGLSTYVKYSTGYKSGGTNSRSESLTIYDPESAVTYEVGSKVEFLGRRARINLAVFKTTIKDAQIDFINTHNSSLSESINAKFDSTVKGVELDAQFLLAEGLIFNASYTGLLTHMPDQPNTANGDRLEPFIMTQAPRHAGSAAIDYTLQPWSFGIFSAHLDMTSTSQYAYGSKNFQRMDGYTLWNARVSLGELKFGGLPGSFKVSAWCKNITDEEYIVYAYPIGDPILNVNQSFGDPRTFGVDFTYDL